MSTTPEDFVFVDNEDSLSILIAELEDNEFVSLDTEGNSMFRYYPSVALIQLTVGEHNFIVDPRSGLNLSPLFKTRAMQMPIIHDGDYDLRLLWSGYNYSPPHFFDTMRAARVMGYKHLGLAALVEMHFGVKLEKKYQRANWDLRPLPQEMCQYAVHDTVYLNALRLILLEKLQSSGRLDMFNEECDKLLESVKIPRPVKENRWKIPGSHDLSPCGLNILKVLWEWREKQAASQDRPSFKVISNQLLLELAHKVEQSYPDVRTELLPSLPRHFRGQLMRDFVDTLRSATSVPQSQWPLNPQYHEELLNSRRHRKDDRFRVEGSNSLSPCGLNILKAIWKWRGEQAPILHYPCYAVIPDEIMIEVAKCVEGSFPDVKVELLPTLPPHVKGEMLDSFVAMLRKAVTVPQKDWPESYQPSAKMNELKTLRDNKAKEMGVDPTLLATNTQLKYLAADGDDLWEERFKKAHFLKWQCELWTELFSLSKSEESSSSTVSPPEPSTTAL